MIDIKNTREMVREFFVLQRKFQRNAGKTVVELSQGELAMLGFFVYERKETTPTELSQFFEISTARVANTLNSLEKKGYIERIHDKIDRRRVSVHATEKGKKFFQKKEDEAVIDFDKLLEFLGEKDSENFCRIIEKLNQYFQ